MNRFIIVVEVDHNRAKKAYQKGYDDFMSVYPKLLENAKKVDEKNNELEIMEEIRISNKRKEIEKAREKYKIDKSNWDNTSKWTRGEPPKIPEGCYAYYGTLLPFKSYDEISKHYRTFYVEGVEHTKKSIEDKLNLSMAAEKNFQMTEYDVKDMIRWENGQNIEDIKETYDKQGTS